MNILEQQMRLHELILFMNNVTPKATVFYFSVLDQKKIQNLMREGKKNI